MKMNWGLIGTSVGVVFAGFWTVSCIVSEPLPPRRVPPPRPVVVRPPAPAPVVVVPAPAPAPVVVAPAPVVVKPVAPGPAPAAVVVPPAKTVRTVELYGQIRIGMPRAKVEGILGRPNATEVERGGIVEAWYLPAPPVIKPALPRGPGAISVSYRAGRVVEKRLSAQL